MGWFYRLADSRFLARVGNVQTATRIAAWGALFVMALVVGIVQAIENIATGWLVLIGVGLFGLLFEGLLFIGRRRRSHQVEAESQPEAAGELEPPVADMAEQVAAQLRGLCAKYDEADVSGLLGEYHAKHSVTVQSVFDRLNERGVIDPAKTWLADDPRFGDDLKDLAHLLREAAKRLREQPAAPLKAQKETLAKPDYWANRRLFVRALKIAYQDGARAYDEDTERHIWAPWAQRTQRLIYEALGAQQAHEFDTDWSAGTTALTGFYARLQRLFDLIRDANDVDQALELLPDFDGREWVSQK